MKGSETPWDAEAVCSGQAYKEAIESCSAQLQSGWSLVKRLFQTPKQQRQTSKWD